MCADATVRLSERMTPLGAALRTAMRSRFIGGAPGATVCVALLRGAEATIRSGDRPLRGSLPLDQEHIAAGGHAEQHETKTAGTARWSTYLAASRPRALAPVKARFTGGVDADPAHRVP